MAKEPLSLEENAQVEAVAKFAQDLMVAKMKGTFTPPQPQKRTFNYSSLVSDSDSGCQETFNRSFTHKDWIDGVDLVQAGQTGNDVGFNVRFKQIIADLDAIQRDLTAAFSCISQIRHSLHKSLLELANEVNAIDADVFDLQNRVSALEAQPNPLIAWALVSKNAQGVSAFFSHNVTNVVSDDVGTSRLFINQAAVVGKALCAVMSPFPPLAIGSAVAFKNVVQCVTWDQTGKLVDRDYQVLVFGQ